MKFTHHGKVEVVAERQVDELGDDLVVRVIDTGIGIAPAQIANLFEKFTVADDFSTSKYGGTGLGLALSQRLCKLMGGEIVVESEVDKGSCFTIRLPLVAGTAKGRWLSLRRRWSRRPPAFTCNWMRKPPMPKILLVEDNAINRQTPTRRLQRHGFSVCCICCARTAMSRRVDPRPIRAIWSATCACCSGPAGTPARAGSRTTDVIRLTGQAGHER